MTVQESVGQHQPAPGPGENAGQHQPAPGPGEKAKDEPAAGQGGKAGNNGPTSGMMTNITQYGHISGPLVIFLIVAVGALVFFLRPPHTGSFDTRPMTVPAQPKSCLRATVPSSVKVSPAIGSGAIMNIYIGADGNRVLGESPALAVQNGTLCPGSIWTMRRSQFTRTDGHTMQQDQVTSWGQVNNSGTQLTVWVLAAPHHGPLASGPGLYSGSVALDSSVVQGAQVPVRIHVAYQNPYLIFAFGFLAAFGGFTWAMLLYSASGAAANRGHLFRNLTLCIAVLLAAAIPVVNVQVLSKPDWQGTLSQFIGLATLIGAAAIALTPTLRALVLPRSFLESAAGRQDLESQRVP